MKARIRSAQELARDSQELLSRKYSNPAEALDELVALLSNGRRYEWIGIYLNAGKTSGAPEWRTGDGEATPEGTKTRVAVKIATETLGAVEICHESKTLSYEDQVLLKRVAAQLAKYLSTTGKPLMRKLRERAAGHSENGSAQKLRPESDRATPRQRAVGAPSRA